MGCGPSSGPAGHLPPEGKGLGGAVEDACSTFQSGAAAKRGAKSHTAFPPRKDEIPISRGGKVVCLSAHRSRKGVKGPLVPCGVSFPSFPLCPKNASAGAMGFWLTERIQRAQRVGLSLVKERGPSETEQDNGVARSSSVRTIPQSRLRRASSLFRDTPKIRANGDGFLAGGTHAARSA